MTAHRLVLLRHAKAVEHAPDGGGDHGRPLSTKGWRDAGAAGAWLRAQDLTPDVVLCSGALRTRQTWEGTGLQADEVVTTDALYETDVAGVLAELAGVDPSAGTVLVVGHEPTTSAVARHLAGAGSEDGALLAVRLGLRTAGLAVVDVEQWSATTGVLRTVATPRPGPPDAGQP